MKQYWDVEKLETAIQESGGDIPLRLVVGPNRIGKTWGGGKLVTDTLHNGNNVLWLRMFDEEFKGEFKANFINILHEKDETLNLEECEGGVKLDGVQRIYFRSLNVFGKARGNGSTTGDVTLVILDEFIPEDGRVPRLGVYLPLMALIRTFSNYSDKCICYCFANCISPLSDLFAALQAFPSKSKDVTVFKDKGVAIEVCRGYKGKIPEDGAWSRVVESGKMRTYKEFEGLYIDDFIIKPRKPIATKTSLKISDHEYITLFNDNQNQIWMLCSKPPSGGIAYSTDADIKCVFLDAKIKGEIRKMFFGGRYRFSNYNALSRFLDMIEVILV